MATSLRSKIQEFPERVEPLTSAESGLGRLLFRAVPTETIPFAFSMLRIGLGVVLLLQAAMIAPIFLAMYGDAGIVQGSLAESIADPTLPSFFMLGVRSDVVRVAFGLAYVAAVLAMTLGWQTRVATILTWLMHLTLTNSGPTHNYGVDQIAKVFLFYLAWAPLPGVLSIDGWRRSEARRTHGLGAAVLLLIMQLQLAVIYLASGVEKAVGEQWRNGDAIWRSLMLPMFQQGVDFGWLAAMPWMAQLIGLGTLVVEIGYVALIWSSRTRALWLALTIAMHVGIGLFMGLHLFALLMIVLNVALFGGIRLRRRLEPVA